MPRNVAIDGPAGAGKSSIARRAASTLGFTYVDTGALYRSIGYYAIQNGVSPDDATHVVPLLEGLEISIRFVEGLQRVFIGEMDVTNKIRTPQMSMAASSVSSMPEVRRFLFDLQRHIATQQDMIMDGRDIGTVVLPNADLKIYLTASDEDRAQRRFDELIENGQNVRYEDVLDEVRKRDHQDRTRKVAPLRVADDAVLVDTTGNTFEQSVTAITNLIREKLKL